LIGYISYPVINTFVVIAITAKCIREMGNTYTIVRLGTPGLEILESPGKTVCLRYQ
jgi:hypothetical protein